MKDDPTFDSDCTEARQSMGAIVGRSCQAWIQTQAGIVVGTAGNTWLALPVLSLDIWTFTVHGFRTGTNEEEPLLTMICLQVGGVAKQR